MALPLPNQVYIPATSSSNTLLYDDTSIVLADIGNDAFISMKTNNKPALLIDKNQKLAINTTSTNISAQVNINGSSNEILKLTRQNLVPVTFYLNPAGDLTIDITGSKVSFSNGVDITNHTSETPKFFLGGGSVVATSTELNYVHTIEGYAQPSKALVTDTQTNIYDINTLQASSIQGTLITSSQPNLTSVNRLHIIEHDGISKGLTLGGVLVTATATELNYTNITNMGIAEANKVLVLDGSRNISGIQSLSAVSLTGTLLTGPQPNITALGTLTSLSVNGKIGIGYTGVNVSATFDIQSSNGNDYIRLSDPILASTKYASINLTLDGGLQLSSTAETIIIKNNHDFRIQTHNGVNKGLWLNNVLVRASADQLNYLTVTPGTSTASKALVVDASRRIYGIDTIQSEVILGTLITPSQPHINQVNQLNISQHNGVDKGLSLNGVLVTSSAAQLNALQVTEGVATASKVLVVNSNRNITNINEVQCTDLYGTIRSPVQPYINRVENLRITLHDGLENGLTLGTELVLASAQQLNYNRVTPGVGTASRTVVLNAFRDITNINALSASTVSGTLLTGPQPNITSVTTLHITGHNGNTAGLRLDGVLVMATATELNYTRVNPGDAMPFKAMVMDATNSISGINNITAEFVGGVLTTPNQPIINSVNTLNIANHNGASTGLRLGGVLLTASATELNFIDVLPGVGNPLKALVLDSSSNITGINEITATTFRGNVITSYQPNINQVNALNIVNHNGSTGLRLGGVLVVSTADQLNRTISVEGVATASKAVVLDSQKNIYGINNLSAFGITGTLLTSNQPNINIVNVLEIQNHNGTNAGLSLGGVLVKSTAAQLNYLTVPIGSAESLKALVVDLNRNISNINALSASTLTGTILTNAQPNITSVSTLNIINHNGSTGLSLNGSLVSASAAQLNYTTAIPGSASPSKALILNAFGSVSGVNTLNAIKLVSEALEVSGVIKNLNVGAWRTCIYSSVDLIGRMVDTQLITTTTFGNISVGGITNNFSMEIIGYILPQYSESYTFYIQCQGRVRFWVNNKLLLHSWTNITPPRATSTIFLNANTWYPIYVQYQIDTNTSSFSLEWNSSSTIRSAIQSNRMAWDNLDPPHGIHFHTQNSMVIYNATTAGLNQTSFTVDNSGDLLIDSSGNDIRFGFNDNVDIASHDGVSSGLYLGGQLVRPTAFELNYLKVSPGTVTPSHALVVDGTSSITGISSLTAASITCTNLTASNFTISNLTLTGPLSNLNVGGLLIKQIMGQNLTGRIVDVNVITTLALTDYDPKGLNNNFSLEISGYILPQFTENYIFYVTANDRARIWVNDRLILNVWDSYTGLEYASAPIGLIANQWTRIYIQFQNITGSSLLEMKWSSQSTSKNLINASFMAWDNRQLNVSARMTSLDAITIASSAPSIGVQTGSITIDATGVMTLETNGSGMITTASDSNFNITGHNGTNRGLMLNGILVTASATELNYLKNATFGIGGNNQVMILDNTRSISNINTLTASTLIGTLGAGPQPNITSIGTLTSTFSLQSDALIGDLTGVNGRIRLVTAAGVSYIQSGTSATTNNVNDLMIGSMNTTITDSSRKFMIKANGFVGIQTHTPTRSLSINANGNTYGVRFIHNNDTGTETSGFVDMGTDVSGNFNIAPNGTVCHIISSLRIGSLVDNALFETSSSSLKITPSSGCLQIGNTTNTNLPLELGSVSFSISSGQYGFINASGATGSSSNTSISTFSLRTTGRIIAGGEIDIVSDRRSKHTIASLDTSFCKSFIQSTQAVSFKYNRTDENKTHYGYIAQDVYKAGFENLVSTVPDETIEASVDEDGFHNPEKQKFVLCYDEIIPIVATSIKDLYEENRQLKETIASLIDEIKWIKSKLI